MTENESTVDRYSKEMAAGPFLFDGDDVLRIDGVTGSGQHRIASLLPGMRNGAPQLPWYAGNPQCTARDEQGRDCILPGGHDDAEDHANQHGRWPGNCGVCGSDNRAVKLFDDCPDGWHTDEDC